MDNRKTIRELLGACKTLGLSQREAYNYVYDSLTQPNLPFKLMPACVGREWANEPRRAAAIRERSRRRQERRRASTAGRAHSGERNRRVVATMVYPQPGTDAFNLAMAHGLPLQQIYYHATKGWRVRRIPR